MQLAGHPVISMHQVLFGRHPPVLWLVFFSHSNGGVWWHSWQSDPWSSGSWHLPFHPMRRPPLAWALHGVVQCDGLDVARSFPCMWPFQWNWPAAVCLWEGSSLLFPVSSLGRDACHQHCTPHQRMRPLDVSVLISYCSVPSLLFGLHWGGWLDWHHGLLRIHRTLQCHRGCFSLLGTSHDEVHLHLEDILWHFGSEGHSLEPVPAFVSVYYQ